MDIVIFVLVLIALLIFGTAFVCFRMAFYNPKSKQTDPEVFDLPDGTIYKPYHEQSRNHVLLCQDG